MLIHQKLNASLKKKAPWWNLELYQMRQLLRSARKNSRQLGDPRAISLTKLRKAQYQREIRRAKAKSWKEFCSVDLNEDPFKAMKKIAGKLRGVSLHEIRDADGQLTNSEPRILATLAEKFFPKPTTANTSGIVVVVQSEVDHAVQNLKLKRAPGSDGITAEHIQILYGVIKPFLFKIFYACLQTSYFPIKWKSAQVLIIPKPHKEDYTDPSAYRPISLLSLLGKCLEKIILRRLNYLANEQGWLSNNQHGFRNGFSTISAIDSLTRQIHHGLNCKAYSACVLLDIKGAFDNVWHVAIIKSIISKNCPEYIVSLITRFLANRSATLSLNNTNLSTIIEKGCPQGSLLSPLLWNLVVDEALNLRLPQGIHIQAYADDLVLIKTGLRADIIQRDLQNACSVLIQWGRSVQLGFPSQKQNL